MYAHITTYRLGSEPETRAEIDHWLETGEVISDQAARTVASWWHAPGCADLHMTALSHGRSFDTDSLAYEIANNVEKCSTPESDMRDVDLIELDALLAWLENLEAVLSE